MRSNARDLNNEWIIGEFGEEWHLGGTKERKVNIIYRTLKLQCLPFICRLMCSMISSRQRESLQLWYGLG
jgi:hypothetical protein